MAAPELEPTVTLPWLVRLRWLFLAGQLVVMPIAHFGFGVGVGWWALGVATGVTAISNLVITRLPLFRRWSRTRLMGGVLILDIALMTVLFAASGGAMNPFTVFYLVHVTLAAVVLDARWTIVLAALSMAGFGLLFAIPEGADPHAGHRMASTPGMNHLQGMWAAFALAAGLIAFFVGRITRAIAVQRDQIATLREASARNARLAALTTLAAGAAHELNNP
ncbi:MAG: sensor histidine kinase, partial [Deltaproteobacteria bacterium]|nr:sensor histidine kinase [Deltaproteobacteria bacterium]